MRHRPVVAITGANGYVGSVIVNALQKEAQVLGLVRSPIGADQISWSFDGDPERLANELRNHAVTHLLHAAWDMKASSATAQRSCVNGSRSLFAAAQSAGIRKLIFLSSISAFDGARSAYGRSKFEVEGMALRADGLVLRLGLIYGDRGGGLLGNIRQVVRTSRFIPMIGNGKAPQYLLHERALVHIVRCAVRGDFVGESKPIIVAQPEPIPFRDVLLHIAAKEERSVTLIPIPWPIFYAALLSAERLGLRLKFRSDSVLSFVYQNIAPDFSQMRRHGIDPTCFRTI